MCGVYITMHGRQATAGSRTRINASLRPTPETYDALQRAYEYLNARLFDDGLPNCVITLRRHAKSYGYFSGDRFVSGNGELTDEIALNPLHFQNRSLKDILSTLVHEMVHLWQHHNGKPGRGNYHNREWADRMIRIGLHPSDTGGPGGNETGDRMSHYTIEAGPFDQAATMLERQRFTVPWSEREAKKNLSPEEPDGEGGDDKSGQRQKYTCPACGLNAWAKHEAKLICGEDKEVMPPVD